MSHDCNICDFSRRTPIGNWVCKAEDKYTTGLARVTAVMPDKCPLIDYEKDGLLTENEALKAKVSELTEECRQSRTAKEDYITLKSCYKELETDNQRMREGLESLINRRWSASEVEQSMCEEISEIISLQGGK